MQLFLHCSQIIILIECVSSLPEQATKLRSLVRKSEKRSEECQESLNDLNLERERMNAEIETLAHENQRYELCFLTKSLMRWIYLSKHTNIFAFSIISQH